MFNLWAADHNTHNAKQYAWMAHKIMLYVLWMQLYVWMKHFSNAILIAPNLCMKCTLTHWFYDSKTLRLLSSLNVLQILPNNQSISIDDLSLNRNVILKLYVIYSWKEIEIESVCYFIYQQLITSLQAMKKVRWNRKTLFSFDRLSISISFHL